MDYLVTGATGFIGQNVVGKLLSEGHSVSYLARKRSPTLDSRAAFHCWNPEQVPPLNSVPVREVVIHLAGEPIAQRWSEDVKRRIRESRVEGTRKLVSAIGDLKHKPSVLISASAVGYYGNRGDEILTESSGPGSRVSRRCLCGMGARGIACSRVWIARRSGPHRAGARPEWRNAEADADSVSAGAGWKTRQRPAMDALDPHGRFGSVVSIRGRESAAVEGPLNASSPKPVTNEEFTKALAATLHRPAMMSVPKFALKLLAGELADSVFDSARVIPKATEASGFRFQYPDIRTLKPCLSSSSLF